MLTDVGGKRFIAFAVVGEPQEGKIGLYPPEFGPDCMRPSLGVCTKPCSVIASVCGGALLHDPLAHGDGSVKGYLGILGRPFDNIPPLARAVLEARLRIRSPWPPAYPLVVGVPGGSEIMRVFGLGNALNRGMQVLGSLVSVDVGEEV